MTRRDLLEGEIRELRKRIDRLETRSPSGQTAITNGRLRIVGPNALLVEGSARVDGTLTIEGVEVVNGELRVVGRLNVTGPTRLIGDTTVAGDLTIAGNTDITGDTDITGSLGIDGPTEITGDTSVKGRLAIEGQTDLTGDMDVRGDIEVLGDGRIRVGSMILDPNVGNGSILFDNGAQVFTNGDTIQVYKGNGVVQISDSEAKLQLGGRSIRIIADGIQIPFLPLIQGTGLPRNTLVVDDGSFLGRASGL